MGKASVEIQGGAWNIIDVIPIKAGEFVQRVDDKYTVLVIFSPQPGGGTSNVKVDSADDGDSLFDMDPKRFQVMGGDVIHPDGFAFGIGTCRGEIKSTLLLNANNLLAGIKSDAFPAASFDDSLEFMMQHFIAFTNRLVSKYRAPIYIKRIVAKNSAGIFRAWFIAGLRPVQWDGTVPYPETNKLRNHVLSIRKEIYTSYQNPTSTLAAHTKLWEMFDRALKQAEKRGVTDVISKLGPLKSKKIAPANPPSPLDGKSYEDAFNTIKRNVRDPVSHGHLPFDDDFANHDNIKLVLQCLKYSIGINQASDEIFEALIELPLSFEVDTKSR
jgi:hypothetical protein